MCGIASSQFDRFSRQVLEQRNAGHLRLSVVAHPIGGIPPAAARDRITPEALDDVLDALTAPETR